MQKNKIYFKSYDDVPILNNTFFVWLYLENATKMMMLGILK